MKMDGKGCALILGILALIGAVVGFALWAFRLVDPIWILWLTIGVPVGLSIILFVIMVLAQIRDNWRRERRNRHGG